MRTKIICVGVILGLMTGGFIPALAQQEDDVRGAFLTTRPKPSNQPAPSRKPSRRRPKAEVKPTPNPGNTGAKPVNPSDTSGATTAKVVRPRLGLGMTLFMRDSNGMAIRTDPSREFRKGDHVRVLIETNADGYLYIFNATDGGQPVMIYPDPELDEAGNYVEGHVPFEIPSSLASEERLRWFTFDQNSGAEKLFFVFTREPLSGVPMEDDLITFCQENKGKCPWQPAPDVWAQISKELNEPAKIAKGQSTGGAQTSSEQQAATRGIGLNRDDPEPSLIMLTTSTNKNMLVATMDLIHKGEAAKPGGND